MTYQLKSGEEIKGGKLYGWTGNRCGKCDGHGVTYNPCTDNESRCSACGGTGDEWGLMPVQPDGLKEGV